MTFQPYTTRSGYVALIIAAFFGVAAVYLFSIIFQPGQKTLSDIAISLHQDAVALLFVLLIGCLLALIITLMAVYWVIVTVKLNYHLDRNGLFIQWGLSRYCVPFDAIKAVTRGQDVLTTFRFWEINFTGLRFGRGQTNDGTPLKFHTTASLADSVLVTTSDQTYVISPRQPERFLQAWQERQKLGLTQQWSNTIYRSWPLNSPLLVDQLAWWFLGVAALLWLALVGYLAFNYTDLPASLPIHFNALGRADRITSKSTLLILPAAGAIVWLVNALVGELIYHRERVAAYFLWAGALVMQVCLWVALRMIMG
jgi:hypothetical protein